MDAHDAPSPSSVGTPPTPACDAPQPATALQPTLTPDPPTPSLRGLYASPGGPSVLVYFPDHHNLAMPLVPKVLEREPEPALTTRFPLPFRYRFRFIRPCGEVIEVTVRIAFSPPPLGDGWSTRRVGALHVGVRIDA